MSRSFDAVVVGGGLAGMLTALELRPLQVALVSYRSLGEATSSAWAQGGIAAAVGDDDSPALHAADTVRAGAGLVEARVAARLAADAPGAIERIAALGVRFDRGAGAGAAYALGREAAHSRRRILRAGGDATGAELVRALVEAVRSSGTIERLEGARALELLVRDGCMNGIVVRHAGGACETLASGAVILATGGIGGLYAYTTNPRASRGAGIAMAARAGARLADLEFVQFHPTALDVPSDPLPLLTEALRGEGALLIDGAGARIMAGIDPALELAPRDRVARRVFALRQAGIRAYLDARHLGDELPTRFPTVFAHCSRFGMDPRTQPIPVVAAAHYHMGGIAVDLNGRTSIAGLYACGEVAASGVHGANRLASNSLLESVVYPERIAVQVKLQPARTQSAQEAPAADAEIAPQPEAWRILRAQMYDNVGVDRDEARLQQARAAFQALASNPDRELRDAALVASLIAHAALRRRETRGSHIRRDFPASEPQEEHRSFLTLSEMAPAAGRSA